MPIQINKDWHKLQRLADVSWFNVRTGSVTRLLPDLLESLQALLFHQVFPLQFNSAATLAWLYGIESKEDQRILQE